MVSFEDLSHAQSENHSLYDGKDGWRISASLHYRKVKRIHLSMAAAILSKRCHLEPESAQ